MTGTMMAVGWTWLAIIMAANVALSLYFYARGLEPLYLRRGDDAMPGVESRAAGFVLLFLAAGSVASGVLPQPWIAFAETTSELLGATTMGLHGGGSQSRAHHLTLAP